MQQDDKLREGAEKRVWSYVRSATGSDCMGLPILRSRVIRRIDWKESSKHKRHGRTDSSGSSTTQRTTKCSVTYVVAIQHKDSTSP